MDRWADRPPAAPGDGCPEIESLRRPRDKLRLRPVADASPSPADPQRRASDSPPPATPPESPRPEIRSPEGLRRVFQARPGEEPPQPPPRPAAQKPPAETPPKPTPRKPASRPVVTSPEPPAGEPSELATLGGVRTASLEPKGPQPRAAARRTGQFLASKALTLIEIITVSALVIVVILSVTNLMSLNQEAAAEQRKLLSPTAEPARRRAVLPGSSQPPPGEEEIPPQFRPYLLPSTPVPLPTPGPRQATRIVIQKIGVDAPVLEGDDWQTLKKGVGHTPGTANPGEAGNCVMSGHDDVYGEVFRYLSDLKPGDEVRVYTSDGRGFKYVVKTSFLVLPDAVEVLDPTPDPILTLITCYPYLVDSHRLIVVCTLAGDAPPG